MGSRLLRLQLLNPVSDRGLRGAGQQKPLTGFGKRRKIPLGGFNYEEMVQEGLRSVVRETLEITALEGLPGAHHFYIAFKTDYPGVQLPEYLRERHPEEMTIVVQHQYWGLEVDENGFFISLSFSESQERIYVPFHALLSFMDPYAKFGLQFVPPPVFELEETPVQKLPSSSDATGNIVSLDTFRKK
ncbi:MAG: hypothetical protein HYX35_02220 [Proteobacteria bacterium]|nr:hypothetical protein [Pseudomonadota bacterium]